MGLDWIVGSKAKPGHEDEFARLMDEEREEELTDAEQERLDAISIAGYETVGAPIVGRDKLADAWVLFHLRNMPEDEEAEEYPWPEAADLTADGASTPQNDDERSELEDMAGYHVLELAPECDGLPIYTHGGMMDELDLTSFRGKFLHDCEEIIGDDLLARAYEDQSAEELEAFGALLIDHAERYAEEHGCADVEQLREPPEDEESPAFRAHILFAAGKWCRYWGSRGFPLIAWS